MALQGNCTHKEYNTVDDEMVVTPTDYTDVYVMVKQVEFFQTYQDQSLEGEEPNIVKHQAVLFQIAGYESKEARDADQEDWLFWEPMELLDYVYSANLLEQCYNKVKGAEGYTELTDI